MAAVLVSSPHPQTITLTLNRPAALNALNASLLSELTTALRAHAHSRVIILEGAGDRAFCAGEDLKETLAPRTGSPAELRDAFIKLQDLTRLTACASAVVIAAVQGFAIGGGAELALAADFVIGGPGAVFKFPEASIGHAVTGGISARLGAMVGLLKAKKLLMLGKATGAEEALRIGLLSEVVADPKARARELAGEIVGLPGPAVACSKMAVERASFPFMEGVLQDEVNVASYCFAQSDAARAFENFAARKAKESTMRAAVDGTTACGDDKVATRLGAIKDINTAFATAVRATPERTFLRFAGTDHSFRAFDVSVAALAGGLRQRGVSTGDRVLVMMRNGVEMCHSWLATNRLGAIWVPINVELKSTTLAHVVGAADATLAIVDAEFVDEMTGTGVVAAEEVYVLGGGGGGEGAQRDMGQLYGEEAIFDAVPVRPGSTAAFLYTSGTTGRTKPCMLSHRYFIAQASELITSFGLRADDVLYCPFPLFHADATALTLIPALLLGATAALARRFSVSKFWDEVRATKATVYDFMGATLALLYKAPPTALDRTHSVRLAWGVPVPKFAQEYEARFGHALRTLYGSVEASIPITQKGPLAPGSCGTVTKGYQLRIADAHDEAVPVGTPGEMLLRSDVPDAFFQGYFNDPGATATTLANQWLHTGDIGRVDEGGNVYFVGRVKDVIRRRGENVNAAEVEEEFLRHPQVETAAAVGVPSALGAGTEEDVKVAVKLCGGATVDEQGLWEWSRGSMARFQVPSVIEIVACLKKTPTGKIEKREIGRGGKRFDVRV